jgi:hypothetical protein
MPQSAYPTMIDLGAWLQDAGFTAAAVANLDLETAAAAGIATFEQAVGRRMLATTQTREFDLPSHPRGILDLRADLASLTSVTVSGTAQVLNTDVRLREPNAADEGRPYWGLQFYRRFYPTSYPLAAWGQVVVTGLWGYAATIPDDVWQAMLAAAGLSLFPYLAQEFSRGAITYKEQDVTEEYGKDPMGSFRDNWSLALYGPPGPGGIQGCSGVVGRYRRVTMS